MKGEAQAIVLQKPNKLRLQQASYQASHPNDVIVKTIASTITPGFDRLLLTNKAVSNKVFNYPLMPGSESIGQVVKTGGGVTDLKAGDFVYAFKGNRWTGVEPYFGCHAEIIPTSRENLFALGRQPVHRDLLTGLLAYAISAIRKIDISHSSRILLLGLGSVGLMVSEYLYSLGYRHVDAVETFGIRGQMSHAEHLAIELEDFTTEFNNSYDIIFETTGRILLVEKAIHLLKPGGRIMLMGNYEVMAYDYRLIQHKEPVIICSAVTTIPDIIEASAILTDDKFDSEKFFTNVFPVSQYELAYRAALDSKESIKAVICWI
ncbi:MAG: zinc-binding alcohol dehydrogenase [Chlorobiaceae bacterium]|nr:zinc-binding alcohol dehydrogenase [Chlorobiaceae bacterium]